MKFATIKSVFSKVKSLSALLPPPLREVLSENGIGSYSRYSGFLIIIATICWVSYLVIHNKAFPDMTGPTAFVAGGQAQYAANQIKLIVAASKGNTPTATSDIPTGAPSNDDASQS